MVTEITLNDRKIINTTWVSIGVAFVVVEASWRYARAWLIIKLFAKFCKICFEVTANSIVTEFSGAIAIVQLEHFFILVEVLVRSKRNKSVVLSRPPIMCSCPLDTGLPHYQFSFPVIFMSSLQLDDGPCHSSSLCPWSPSNYFSVPFIFICA